MHEAGCQGEGGGGAEGSGGWERRPWEDEEDGHGEDGEGEFGGYVEGFDYVGARVGELVMGQVGLSKVGSPFLSVIDSHLAWRGNGEKGCSGFLMNDCLCIQ